MRDADWLRAAVASGVAGIALCTLGYSLYAGSFSAEDEPVLGSEDQVELVVEEEAVPYTFVVLWDFENVMMPANTCGAKFIARITYLLRLLVPGCTVRLVGVGNMCVLCGDDSKPRELFFSEMRAAAVELHHVPSRKPESADKALLLEFALALRQDPQTTGIAFCSGDFDFAPALCTARRLGFRTAVLYPVADSGALGHAADHVFDWSKDVLAFCRQTAKARLVPVVGESVWRGEGGAAEGRAKMSAGAQLGAAAKLSVERDGAAGKVTGQGGKGVVGGKGGKTSSGGKGKLKASRSGGAGSGIDLGKGAAGKAASGSAGKGGSAARSSYIAEKDDVVVVGRPRVSVWSRKVSPFTPARPSSGKTGETECSPRSPVADSSLSSTRHSVAVSALQPTGKVAPAEARLPLMPGSLFHALSTSSLWTASAVSQPNALENSADSKLSALSGSSVPDLSSSTGTAVPQLKARSATAPSATSVSAEVVAPVGMADDDAGTEVTLGSGSKAAPSTARELTFPVEGGSFGEGIKPESNLDGEPAVSIISTDDLEASKEVVAADEQNALLQPVMKLGTAARLSATAKLSAAREAGFSAAPSAASQGGRRFKGSGPGKTPVVDLSSPTSPEAVDSGKLSESSGMSNFTPLKEESFWAGEPSTSEVDGFPFVSPSLLGIALPVEPVEPVVPQPVPVAGKCSLLSCYVCYPSAMRGGDGLTPTTRINGQYIYCPRAANEKLDVLRGSFVGANQLSRAIPITNPISGAPMPPVAQYSTYTAPSTLPSTPSRLAIQPAQDQSSSGADHARVYQPVSENPGSEQSSASVSPKFEKKMTKKEKKRELKAAKKVARDEWNAANGQVTQRSLVRKQSSQRASASERNTQRASVSDGPIVESRNLFIRRDGRPSVLEITYPPAAPTVLADTNENQSSSTTEAPQESNLEVSGTVSDRDVTGKIAVCSADETDVGFYRIALLQSCASFLWPVSTPREGLAFVWLALCLALLSSGSLAETIVLAWTTHRVVAFALWASHFVLSSAGIYIIRVGPSLRTAAVNFIRMQ